MLAYPTMSTDMRDILARDAFIEPLDGRTLSIRVREREPKSLSEALTYCMKLETIYAASDQQRDQARPRQIRATQVDEVQSPQLQEVRSFSENKTYANDANSGGRSDVRRLRREHGRAVKAANAEMTTPAVEKCQNQERQEIAALRKQVEELKLQLPSVSASARAPPMTSPPP